MSKCRVKIRGIKPLIMHRFNLESITAQRKPKSGSSGNDPDEWKVSFHHNGGKIYVPGAYIFAALKNGSVNTKVGRGTIQKTLISAINIDEEIIYTNREMFDKWESMEIDAVPKDSSLPVYVDVRAVSNPNTKGKNIRYRLALSKGWELEFNVILDDTLISQSQMKKVIEDTGKLQGLCDARTLGYGRFELVEFEVEK